MDQLIVNLFSSRFSFNNSYRVVRVHLSIMFHGIEVKDSPVLKPEPLIIFQTLYLKFQRQIIMSYFISLEPEGRIISHRVNALMAPNK